MKAAMLETFKNACSQFPLCSEDDVTGMTEATILVLAHIVQHFRNLLAIKFLNDNNDFDCTLNI